MGRLGAMFGAFEVLLGFSWGLGAILEDIAQRREALTALPLVGPLKHHRLGRSWGRLGALLGPILGPSWAILEPS